MKYQTFYLNGSGSRWILAKYSGRGLQKVKVRVIPDRFNGLNEPLTRTAIEFKQYGFEASVFVSIKGKKTEIHSFELLEVEA